MCVYDRRSLTADSVLEGVFIEKKNKENRKDVVVVSWIDSGVLAAVVVGTEEDSFDCPPNPYRPR